MIDRELCAGGLAHSRRSPEVGASLSCQLHCLHPMPSEPPALGSLIRGGGELPRASFAAENELPHVAMKERLACLGLLGGLLWPAGHCRRPTAGEGEAPALQEGAGKRVAEAGNSL